MKISPVIALLLASDGALGLSMKNHAGQRQLSQKTPASNKLIMATKPTPAEQSVTKSLLNKQVAPQKLTKVHAKGTACTGSNCEPGG